MLIFGHAYRFRRPFLWAMEFFAMAVGLYLLAQIVFPSTIGSRVHFLDNVVIVPALCSGLLSLFFGAFDLNSISNLAISRSRIAWAATFGCIIAWFILYKLDDRWISPLYSGAMIIVTNLAVLAVRYITTSTGISWSFKRRSIVIGSEEERKQAVKLHREKGDHFYLAATAGSLSDEELLEKLKSLAVQEVVLGLNSSREVPTRTLFDLKIKGIAITDFPSFYERETGKVYLKDFSISRMIVGTQFRHSQSVRSIKRLFDIAVASLGLLLSLPITLLTAVAIKLDSSGPVFYRQQRVGLNGKPFNIVKFRSMRRDAEKTGARWTLDKDHRITKVGKLIRRVRIDEIPQLWNVLIGEMSIIGPRPERPMFVEKLNQRIPFFADRQLVKPGITGWAQVSFRYGASLEDAKEKLAYDLYYMKNFSLLLDFEILIKTIPVILGMVGSR